MMLLINFINVVMDRPDFYALTISFVLSSGGGHREMVREWKVKLGFIDSYKQFVKVEKANSDGLMEGPDSPGFLLYLNTTRNELKKKLVFDDVGDATLIVNLREMWSELNDEVKRSYEKYAAASKRKMPGHDPAFLIWYFTYWQDEKRKYPNLNEKDGSSIKKAKEVWSDENQTSYVLKEFFEKLAAASGQGTNGKPIVQKERKVLQKRRWL